MEDSDSENEGQLLIDESVDASKKRGRKPITKSIKSVPKTKKSAKLGTPTTTAKATRRERPKQKIDVESEKSNTAVNVRTSNRVRKRVRRHSPSPVRNKKEPPKKKLKVKIKNFKKNKKSPVKQKKEVKDEESIKDNVDVESISDEELANIQYASVMVDKDDTEKQRKQEKPKGGIKLKLSLGKVLSSPTPDLTESEEPTLDTSSFLESSMESTVETEKPVVQPLIITKRQDASAVTGDCYDISSQTLPEPSNVEVSSQFTSTDNDSQYHSSISEDHKPLILKLSVGRPKIAKQQSVSESERKTENAFPNIRRSWSVAYPIREEPTPKESLPTIDKKKAELQEVKEKSNPAAPLSTTPYFSAGLQSLLDVVSVEIKEQSKTSDVFATSDSVGLQRSQQLQDPLKQPLPLESHFLIRPTSNLPKVTSDEKSSNHQGHLPSLAFPKPKLNFSSKKRSRAKLTTKASPERPSTLLTSVFEVKCQNNDNVETDETGVDELTEKEKRRRDKKKTLNSDFVDPDTLMPGPELAEKIDPAWKKPASSLSSSMKPKIGFSLLTPQMASRQSTGADLNLLQMSSSCKLPNKSNSSIVSKRPKKGLATTKQRLANKLKMGKAFAF